MAKTMINLVCDRCSKKFERYESDHICNLKRGRKGIFCSKLCRDKSGIGGHNKKKNPFGTYIWGTKPRSGMCRSKQKLEKMGDATVTAEYLAALWDKQEGKCALTGIPLKMHKGRMRKDLFTASLDRIDSNKGYHEGNVQFVSLFANYAKNKFSEEHFYEVLSLIIDNQIKMSYI